MLRGPRLAKAHHLANLKKECEKMANTTKNAKSNGSKAKAKTTAKNTKN